MTDPATLDEATYLARLNDIQAANWPKGVARDVTYPLGKIALSEHVRHWARATPDAAAIIWYGRIITYGEMDALSDRFATVLKAAGIGAGDRVGVFLPNCPQFHIAFFAILKIGAVHCPISPMSTGAELDYMLADTGAKGLVTLDALMEVVAHAPAATGLNTIWTAAMADMRPDAPTMQLPPIAAADPVPTTGTVDFMTAVRAAERSVDAPADPDAIAALNYTGGTTGMPKGCVHTQGDMVFTAAANWSVGRGTPEEEAKTVIASFFPEFWIAGQNGALLFPVLTGRPILLMARWDPLALLQGIAAHHVTAVTTIVDGAMELMAHPRFGEFDLSSIRTARCVSFVKKLDADVRRRWFDKTATVLAEASWGMTETHTSNTFTGGMQDGNFDLNSRPVFVGMPVPGNEFKICDFDTGAILPLGAEGEIRFRSPGMLKSYWNKPEATAEALGDGWLKSGDIGVIDADGYLHYLGRRKEMLKVRGMSVFPAELEAVLGRLDDVLGAAVVGRADDHAGQIPVAFVMVRPGSGRTAESVAEWLRAQVSAYKMPEIHILDALPMTATGKVKKTDLAKMLEQPL
jgi:fatty-acyl-CoA synthase